VFHGEAFLRRFMADINGSGTVCPPKPPKLEGLEWIPAKASADSDKRRDEAGVLEVTDLF